MKTRKPKYVGPNRRDLSARLSAVEAGQTTHEQRCDIRYQGIELNTAAIKDEIKTVKDSLKANTDTTNRIWWAVLGGGGATMLLLAKLALFH